jgi:hypothetical protein
MQHVRDAFSELPTTVTYRDSLDVGFTQTAVLMCCTRAFTYEGCEVSLMICFETEKQVHSVSLLL